jgi:thiamine-phosphate pyrophosphorylase
VSRSRSLGEQRRERLRRARLYLVVEARPEPFLDAALRGGVDMLQLRDKDASDDELLAAAAAFRRACDEHGALLWLNDRPDLAVAAGADGVHVGQDDEAVAAVRERVGHDLLIGLSTHSPAQLQAAVSAGVADELSVGPVYATPTKAGRAAVGLDYVRYAVRHAGDRPWFAIGGIDRDTVHEVTAAGASRICVVRAIRDAADPTAAAAELRAALEAGSGGGGEPR